MKNVIYIVAIFWFITSCVHQVAETTDSGVKESTSELPTQAAIAESDDYAIVIHGGAGYIKPGRLPESQETGIRQTMDGILAYGDSLLRGGAQAIDVVEQVIILLEDCPHFNAGKGAVFTAVATHELDASIMDGRDLNAGAVGGVSTVKNPIRAARAVLDHSPHVLLTGAGADAFSRTQNLDQVDNKYFDTERSRKALNRAIESSTKDDKHGTVGCVVRDKNGHIAAGTSTGGMTYKKYNRLGDSPIIGAGTYADDRSCGVSATGHGEYFIRHAVAHDISSLIRYKNWTGPEASYHVIHNVLNKDAGAGGVIVIDYKGRISMPFNTPGMYRGYAVPGERKVLFYKDENYSK